MTLESHDVRSLPTPSALTAPFWDAARESTLIYPHCTNCHRAFFRPEIVCVHCFSSEWEWRTSAGAGTLHSWSVVSRPALTGMPVPYVVAAVRLDEDWYMFTNIIDCEVGDLRADLPVRVEFRRMNDDISLPFFVPLI